MNASFSLIVCENRCNGSKVVYNASMIWGAVGPMRLFQSGQVYSSLMYFFVIGVRDTHPVSKALIDLFSQPVVTCIVYALYRRYPTSWIRFVNVPIFFNAAGNIPPAVRQEPISPA